VAEAEDAHGTSLTNNNCLFTRKEVSGKKKKEAKKEKRIEIWKTLRVSHIPTRQTNNKLFIIYL
jgi:hypothetical protein